MENPPDPYTFAFPIHIWLPLMVSLYLGLFVYGRSLTKEIAPLADNSPFFFCHNLGNVLLRTWTFPKLIIH